MKTVLTQTSRRPNLVLASISLILLLLTWLKLRRTADACGQLFHARPSSELEAISSSDSHASSRTELSHPPYFPKVAPSPKSYDELLPSDYFQKPSSDPFCSQRYQVEYLERLSKWRTSYCGAKSRSTLNCFHSQTFGEDRIDSLCIGGPTRYSPEEQVFELDCNPDGQQHGEGPNVTGLFKNWDDTGPGHVFEKAVKLAGGAQVQVNASLPRRFSILVQRERIITNTWHVLMQIISLSFSMDVLRSTLEPGTQVPLFTEEDVANTQIVILDDYEEGPYYELWSMFSGLPTVRWRDYSQLNASENYNNHIIVPLAGAANPIWQGDWVVRDCDRSELVRVFAERTLSFHNISTEAPTEEPKLVVTYVDRSQKRRLINKHAHLEKLRLEFPDVVIEAVDFALIPFAEQLKVVRRTDILVGVHGAGLTNSMFMRPGAAVVEILPAVLPHKGFRNLSKLCALHYFGSHASGSVVAGAEADWHDDDVVIEEERFMELLRVAIKSMYNTRLLNADVV